MQSESNIIVVDLFKEIVEAMRTTGSIVASTFETDRYLIESIDHGLSSYDVISIDDIDYIVLVDSDNFFYIDASTGLDFTGKEWFSKAPYYMYGHPLEIINTLTSRNKSKTYQYQKYPLIALFQDFTETIGEDEVNYCTVSPTIIIANITRAEIKAEERYDRNFRDVLYPLYNEFISLIDESNSFNTVDDGLIAHSKTDRLYWGTEEANKNSANKFTDYIDAIEITFNSLPIFNNKC